MNSPTRRLPFRHPSLSACFLVPGMITGLLALAACGSGGGGSGTGGTSSTSSSTGGKSTTGVSTGSSSGAGMGGSITTCPPGMTYGGGEQTLVGTAAKATIVDETGAPVAAGQPLFICGINECSPPGVTGANGSASMTTNLSLKKPAFKYGDALNYAEFAIPLTAATTDFTTIGTGKLATAKLAGTPGATLTAGTAAVAGDVTVSIPAGASVGVNALVYAPGDQQKLRAVNVPLANMSAVLDGVTVGDGGPADFALVYGVAPTETTICPAATVTVALSHATTMPNDLGWAPGAAVEFWIMTVDTGQTYAPYAGWAKMSDGAVSADGKSVTTAAGQGFITLENFAIRLKS